jgi:hypothetical protein
VKKIKYLIFLILQCKTTGESINRIKSDDTSSKGKKMKNT